jgi:hypothetical protein
MSGATQRVGPHWVLSHWWYAGRGGFCIAAAVSSLIVAAGVGVLYLSGHARLELVPLESRRASLREQNSVQPNASIAAASIAAQQPNFTEGLPSSLSGSSALDIIQSAADRATVVVASAQLQESASTTERLGRAELSIATRSTYANAKRWIAEVMERKPAATVSRLQLQRAEGSTDIEARVTFVLSSRPLERPSSERP